MSLEIIKAIILGVVEGFTEFLPISSTGHLILVNQFLSFEKDFTVLFDIVIQLGAIFAVLVYFRKKLWPFAKDHVKNKETLNIWYKTIVAVLPALFFGVLFGNAIENKLFNPWVVAATLLVGGLLILFIEKNYSREGRTEEIKIARVADLSFKTAFFIGLIQCLAMIPGTSRSAVTILGAMALGASRVVATEFSFFLAIPTMFAASAYGLLKHGASLNVSQFFILSVGFIVSFIVALSVTRFLIRFVQKNNFKVFGYYRIILGAIIIASLFIF